MDFARSLVGEGGDCGEANAAIEFSEQFLNPDLHAITQERSFSQSQNHLNQGPSTSSDDATFSMQEILEQMKRCKLSPETPEQAQKRLQKEMDELGAALDVVNIAQIHTDDASTVGIDRFSTSLEDFANQSSELPSKSSEFDSQPDYYSYYSPESYKNTAMDELMLNRQEALERERGLLKMLLNDLNSRETNKINDDISVPEDSQKDFHLSQQAAWDNIAKNLEEAQESAAFELTTSRLLETKDSYPFVENNPFLEEYKAKQNKEDSDLGNQCEEFIKSGLKQIELSDISGGILYFEAAATVDPNSQKAWFELGKATAKNDEDRKAINALKRSLSLLPDNIEAWMLLAICFTNESKTRETFYSLREWITRNPKYAHIVKKYENDLSKIGNNDQYVGPLPMKSRWGQGSGFNSDTFELLLKVYRECLERDSNNEIESTTPNIDIHIGLGVLHSNTGDHRKASEHFKAALQANSSDYTLWNRLGATYANAGMPEAAIYAYKNAIQLFPGYSRARFNVAISCMMIDCNKDAAEHLLTILNHQAAGAKNAMEQIKNKNNLLDVLYNPNKVTSSSVWSALGSCLIKLEYEDLYDAIAKRDLEAINAKIFR